MEMTLELCDRELSRLYDAYDLLMEDVARTAKEHGRKADTRKTAPESARVPTYSSHDAHNLSARLQALAVLAGQIEAIRRVRYTLDQK